MLLSLLIGTQPGDARRPLAERRVGGWAFGLLWVLLTLRLAERLARTAYGYDAAKQKERTQ